MALYNASSLDEMSAAMQGLQQFEALHKEAQRGAREGASGTQRRDGDSEREGEDSFRQQALAFYKSDAGSSGGGGFGLESAQKAALAAQLDRERRRAAAKEREQRLIQTF